MDTMLVHPQITAGSAKLRGLLREWRAQRRMSQLALAAEAGVSQRHLSFIELGRTQPSRNVVLRLTQALDIPLRVRNEFLVAAGYAPVYLERDLDSPSMDRARQALTRILKHHEPYPAMVLDSYWNIVMRNEASKRIFARCIDEAAMRLLSPDKKLNFIRLMFHPKGLRARIRNWESSAPVMLARLRREAISYPGSPSETLWNEFRSKPAEYPALAITSENTLDPTAILALELEEGTVRFFNTLTTFGTPQDLSLQELRIEMSFPADGPTESLLHEWALERK